MIMKFEVLAMKAHIIKMTKEIKSKIFEHLYHVYLVSSTFSEDFF